MTASASETSRSARTTTPDATPDAAGSCLHRRHVLAALPGVVLLPGLLSACGGSESTGDGEKNAAQQSTTVSPSTIPAADVPVGAAKQVKSGSNYVIVAQPEAGKFVAYSAVCTHKGGIVQVVEGMHLRCPLHGAEYDASTGKNTTPPAPRGLDVVPVAKQDDQLKIG